MTDYGILSLADHVTNPLDGRRASQATRLQRVVDTAVEAEEAGFYSFGVGEHHFSGYILSAPELVLAAASSRTSRIRLGTSVTLLANTDPVRQAEQLATLDVLSKGRAEMTFARGVSEHTAHAFGIADFDELRPRFEEYLRLVLRLFTEDEVTWEGDYRAPLDSIRLEPRPIQQPYPGVWIGGGLSNTSSDLAAALGLPLFLPSLFRWPEDYLDIVDRYRLRLAEAGHLSAIRIGFPSYLHVATTSQEARRRWRPHLEHYRDFALTIRSAFGRDTDFDTLLQGPAICGSPAEVVDRIGVINETLGLDRHLFLLDAGAVPQEVLAEEMDLLATEVLPKLS
ncbi:MAG: LLM class flavin-dependent oxidoreductase [Acidimicrobiia bacterium]|nr:LLM class flavin-dependent oxidoreductase [Acidimicrobiia bacterium]